MVTRSLVGREQFLQFQVQHDAVLLRALLYEKHIRKVMIVLPVLMTSCQPSGNLKMDRTRATR